MRKIIAKNLENELTKVLKSPVKVQILGYDDLIVSIDGAIKHKVIFEDISFKVCKEGVTSTDLFFDVINSYKKAIQHRLFKMYLR